ncbi:MAG TPA: serine/threonine-protein kinase [Pirellulales bacterium]|jgi:serine/threonine protein kinase|nr:serine/threonine-protein kinase [Pirellulales bacterium]
MPEAIRIQIDAKTLAVMHSVDALERSNALGAGSLRPFLENVSGEYRLDVLSELVRVDFERQSRRGEVPSVAQYLDEYPELRQCGSSVADLLKLEFETRQRAGQNPSIDDFRRIDPDFSPAPAADTKASAAKTAPLTGPHLALPAAPAAAPERVGKYLIVRQLGVGGFGVVYEAYDEQLERAVAIKIRHGRDGQSGLSADLLHEARSVAQLDHPNIVRLLDAGETPQGLGYVVYEYVDGETLEQTIDRNQYNHAEAVEWVAQVAEALHYAHQRRIVHRDVKPANILLDSAGRPKVLDFGLARRNDQFFQNESGQIVGTLAYLSPEQASGDSDWASSHSDLYSLGVVLYELLCKRLPLQGARASEMLDQILHRTPAPPRSIDDTIPVRLEDACLKALSKRPADRFKTGNDMAAAVRAAIQPPKPLATRLVSVGAGLVALAALCVLVGLLLPSRAVEAPSLPQFSGYTLLMADTETPANSHLPLSPATPLKVEANFTVPAYAYLVVFEPEAAGRLVWPAEQDLAAQHPVSRLIYPPLAGDAAPLLVPEVDGATFVVVLASHQPMTRGVLDEVLSSRLQLNVSQQIAAQAQTSFQVAEPDPKMQTGIPTRGGDGARQATQLRVPDSFKQVLRSHSDAYFGNLVPHAKAGGPAPN